MKTLTDLEIASLTDDQLNDKLSVVFENGLEAEQDPTFKGTSEHTEMLNLDTRLVLEFNRRIGKP